MNQSIEVKDCRTCPFRQEDAMLDNRKFSYYCNQNKNILLQLEPEEVTSEVNYLPELCPLKKDSFEIRLIGSIPLPATEESIKIPIKEVVKEKKPRKKKYKTDEEEDLARARGKLK